MPGSGTDHTKEWVGGGPLVVLVEPQLGANIGMAARAMGNFGLTRLRLVNPRDGWPNIAAQRAAAGADDTIANTTLHDTLQEAIADCHFVLAATARPHDQVKPVIGADAAALEMLPRIAGGENVALVFGRERWGLTNTEIGLCDRVITLPVNPAFASLNLAQAVIIVAYEFFKAQTGAALPFGTPVKSVPAAKVQLHAFFATLERELDRIEYLRPAEKRDTMLVNLRNIFTRADLTTQDVQTLHGVIVALSEGRKGPAAGGVLDGEEAAMLRALLAEHGDGESGPRGPARGLARLLRRNPTGAERILWDALVKDKRFAGRGFKRQVPIGPHIGDVVSFPERAVIAIVAAQETPDASRAREIKNEWMRARDYRVLEIGALALETDREAALTGLFVRLSQP